MSFQIGRVGSDVAIDSPLDWRDEAGRTDRVTIAGDLAATTLANTQLLRTELLAQANGRARVPVTVLWSDDPTRDGFYWIDDIDADLATLNDGGSVRFRAVLTRIGGASSVEFQSLLSGTVALNDHGLVVSEVTPFHAPPVGALVYNAGVGAPTARQRTTEDGAITWFDGIDFTSDPTWSVNPADYYKGAARILVSGSLRAGRECPNAPTVWELSNGLVKVTPAANGRIDVAHYDGTGWDTALTYSIWRDVNVIPSWHYFTIIRNDPEVSGVRLVRDAAENPPTAYQHYLDLNVRRGSRFVEGFYQWSGSTTIDLQIRRETTEAATAVTPTGATTPPAIRATSNDTDGNRYVLGTARAHTQDLTNGRITKAAATSMDFFIGSEIGGSAAVTGDTAEDLTLQYLAYLNEEVRAVRR
jgi:hypothetical protein